MSALSRGEIIDRVAAGTGLRGFNLMRASLSSADLAGADLSDANLRMADLHSANLREARLNGAHLSGAILTGANLAGASLVETTLIGTTLKQTDMTRVDLSGADLTGASLVGAIMPGSYLVGAYLSETDLSEVDLTGAYVRMAQLGGCNMAKARLDAADLSQTDLSGSRLDNCSMVGANLAGASLSGSWVTGCDLRNANLEGANLCGCNLTGAKLYGIRFDGAIMDDAWAEWVDLSEEGDGRHRALLEEIFGDVLARPLAQIIVEGRVTNEVWAQIVAHLSEFQRNRQDLADLRLRAIHQGVTSSVLYLEADRELSLAAYLAELADIVGNGSLELFEKLGEVVAAKNLRASGSQSGGDTSSFSYDSSYRITPTSSDGGYSSTSRLEALQKTPFWKSEKAFAILTARRQIWLEASSSNALTLRPPRGSVAGLDVVRGRFVRTSATYNSHSTESE